MPTRRQFVLDCSAVAFAVSMAPVRVPGASFRFKEIRLEHLGLAAFAAQLNTLFQVRHDSGAVAALQLVEAQPTPPFAGESASAEDARNEKFSLLFRGWLKQRLEQGSYWFEHPAIGRFGLFIVPIGSTETAHRYYEAIFNRPPGGPSPAAGEGRIPTGRPRNDLRQLKPAGGR